MKTLTEYINEANFSVAVDLQNPKNATFLWITTFSGMCLQTQEAQKVIWRINRQKALKQTIHKRKMKTRT